MDASLEALLAHRPWVQSLAAALTQPADAEDLEQETWLAALERPPAPGSGRAWLATVLRRTASNMRRGLSRRAARERTAARSEAYAEDVVAVAETHERVVRAVLALPEPYRSTILLRFFEGLAPKEIARRTGDPLDTVKARLRRGLARLRADLPEGRAWNAALLALTLPTGRPLLLGGLAMTLKTKLLVAAAALIVAASLVTYRALDRAPEPVRAATNLRPAAPSDAAGTDPVDAGLEAPGAPSLPDKPAEREFSVRGLVRGTDGPVHTGTMMRPFQAYAIGVVDGKRRLWTEIVGGDARGNYHVRLPFPGGDTTCEIEFGIVAFGFVRQDRKLVVEPGGEYRADFVLERGAVVAGTVTDTDGRPVPHLGLLAVARKTPPEGLVTGTLLDTDPLLLSSEHFARGDADAYGRFEIRGLVPGTYVLYSMTPDWILEHEQLAAPADDVRVIAVPAHAITGTVRDARTGRYVAAASVIVSIRTPGGFGCVKGGGVRNGRLCIAWKPQRPEIDEGFDATVEVESSGYHAAKQVLAFPRGTRRVAADFALEPVEPEKLALLQLEVTDTRGRAVDLELGCSLSGVDDAAVRATTKEFRCVEPGVFELRAPAGRWSVRLAPRWAMGVEWTGVAEFGRDERIRCTLPSFGVIRVRRAAAGTWYLEAEAPDGNHTYHWEMEAGDVRIAATPGEWKMGRDGAEMRTVVVLDGVETIVEIE